MYLYSPPSFEAKFCPVEAAPLPPQAAARGWESVSARPGLLPVVAWPRPVFLRFGNILNQRNCVRDCHCLRRKINIPSATTSPNTVVCRNQQKQGINIVKITKLIYLSHYPRLDYLFYLLYKYKIT